MPKIYEYLGLVFFFYSNEHLPIHVHVSIGEFESKIILEYDDGKLKNLNILEVKARKPLTHKNLKTALKFIKIYHEGIVDKWTTFFVKNKKVTCEIITQKI